jgi:hypothetical protein
LAILTRRSPISRQEVWATHAMSTNRNAIPEMKIASLSLIPEFIVLSNRADLVFQGFTHDFAM